MCICVYMYMYSCTCMFVYVYVYMRTHVHIIRLGLQGNVTLLVDRVMLLVLGYSLLSLLFFVLLPPSYPSFRPFWFVSLCFVLALVPSSHLHVFSMILFLLPASYVLLPSSCSRHMSVACHWNDVWSIMESHCLFPPPSPLPTIIHR